MLMEIPTGFEAKARVYQDTLRGTSQLEGKRTRN